MLDYEPATGRDKEDSARPRLQRRWGSDFAMAPCPRGKIFVQLKRKELSMFKGGGRANVHQGDGLKVWTRREEGAEQMSKLLRYSAGWECTNVQRCREDAKSLSKKLTGVLATLPKTCVRACVCV